jgi:hypothetical protein
MPMNPTTEAVSWDTWFTWKEHQQCSRVVQKGQCQCPLPRQRHMQVLLYSRNAVYEKHIGVTWTQGQAPHSPRNGQPNIAYLQKVLQPTFIIWGSVCGGNNVNVKQYPHPQPETVLKHLVYICHGHGIQFERFYSLNQSILAWFAHLHQVGFQPTHTNLGKCL